MPSTKSNKFPKMLNKDFATHSFHKESIKFWKMITLLEENNFFKNESKKPLFISLIDILFILLLVRLLSIK